MGVEGRTPPRVPTSPGTESAMRRPTTLALAVLPLLLAPAARATPITMYATGRVTSSRYLPDPNAGLYQFLVGEKIYLTVTYDLDPHDPIPGRTALISGTIASEWGFAREFAMSASAATSASEADGVVRLRYGGPEGVGVDLTIGALGEAGTLAYGRAGGVGAEAFTAAVVRVADEVAFAVPEPSGLALGLVGSGLAGVWWRRKVGAS